jgi:lysophospholipase L1-like esterase
MKALRKVIQNYRKSAVWQFVWIGFLFFGLLACTNPTRTNSHQRPVAPERYEMSEAELRFEPEIAVFDSLLNLETTTRGGIVFTGSSSIKKWLSLQADMAPLPVENRGFGGAIIKQVTHYSDRMIVPLKPKLVVFYCGENDIANDVYPAERALNDYKNFVATLRLKLPQTGILFVSMKPSPLRWQYWNKFKAGNAMIKEYIAQQQNMWYVDVGEAMLGSNGRPRPEIFLSDSLHMNAKGYALWSEILKPEVIRHYEGL